MKGSTNFSIGIKILGVLVVITVLGIVMFGMTDISQIQYMLPMSYVNDTANIKTIYVNRTIYINNTITETKYIEKDPTGKNIIINKTDFVIIAPIRDRDKHAILFTNYMNDYFREYDTSMNLYKIILIEQLNMEIPFNRGMLFNIGVNYVEKNLPNINWMCMHDIDIVPHHLTYKSKDPRFKVKHLVKQRYSGHLGGITCFDKSTYINCVNGFSNNYWGWGCEDDDLCMRVQGCSSIERTRKESLIFIKVFHNRFERNYYDEKYNITTFRYNHQRMSTIYKKHLISKFKKIEGYNTLFNSKYFYPNITETVNNYSNIVYQQVRFEFKYDIKKVFESFLPEFFSIVKGTYQDTFITYNQGI